ncbi:TPA: helix-turn-helix domain-containing protein [Salmonella enterica subsp. enterica serovar Napoli]|nr:helix-turn-helix domain-containing protein [Salmonella enterica subsp. enterica serovar Napoli]
MKKKRIDLHVNQDKPEKRFLSSVGIRCRQRREELKLSRNKVADMVGVSLSTLQAWENQEREPTASDIIQLANTLDVDASWLLSGEQSKEIHSLPIPNEVVPDYDLKFEILRYIFSSLKKEEKDLVIDFMLREGAKNLVQLAAMKASTISPEAVESIIDVLPLRPVLKNAIKIGLAGSEATDKEILCFIERHNASDNATQHAGAVSSGHKKSAS